jgi:hypothetical protein
MTYDERCGSARGRGGKLAKEYEWGEEPHLTAISEKELRACLEKSLCSRPKVWRGSYS